jgi:aminoglycoside N3'-acetyltransferase
MAAGKDVTREDLDRGFAGLGLRAGQTVLVHSALRTVGRVAGKAFAYFFTFSTLALIVGLIVANVVRPGAGMGVDPATLDAVVADIQRIQLEARERGRQTRPRWPISAHRSSGPTRRDEQPR